MDITPLNNLRPIDVLGLKNYRIFDDQEGFLEELSSINILTGANNSGKSSIIKALQMLQNSIRQFRYPFNLDLNQQQHLLGDFHNILFNKNNRIVEITLPYLFMGMKNFSISLTFDSTSTTNTYDARLRGIDIADKSDSITLFSFQFREATDKEKESDKAAYDQRQQEYKKKAAEIPEKDINIFNIANYNFEHSYNTLVGYVEWRINLKKLKNYLNELIKVYEYYLNNKRHLIEDSFKNINDLAKDLFVIPSSFISCFKKDADLEKWKDYIDTKIGNDPELCGKEKIAESDFDADDFLLPPYEIEHILFYKASKILNAKLKWKEIDDADNEYSVIEHCFRNSWESLLQRIETINYVSNIKEENARSYNAASNSPFIKLLKSYAPEGYYGSAFMNKYLKAFEIGKEISVELNPKYQSILVSITTLEGTKRELVDLGYGIKQLVLILMQITVLAQKNRRSEQNYDYEGATIDDTYVPSLLIIEEPESNLHPKWQSLLADMFAEANSKFNIQMIIETHSEYLIRKFQTLVAEKNILAQNIKIFYIRGLNRVTTDKKQVESLYIQNDGTIDFTVFDHGFFDENYNLKIGLLNVQREKFLQDFENLKKSNKESEEKVVELQLRIDSFTDKVDVAKYQQIISSRFDTTKLLMDSVTYLISGQYLLENIYAAGDYSPVIIQYGRAIENELKRIFLSIPSPKPWMFGSMQQQLQNFVNSNAIHTLLPGSLTILFNVPTNLRIDLIDYLRDIRNSAGHAGHIQTKQDALDYIKNSEIFLDKCIVELK
ncbi:AAA family ATPase [Chitinophaga sancti]|uniref:AAA family ATPase n=1 Tax=Chitinophaga sancti TaxID=1004 RepID=UPI003F78D223